MQGSLIDVNPLMTHTLPLPDTRKAFEMASQGTIDQNPDRLQLIYEATNRFGRKR
jgi:hypothetical protein